MKALSYLKQGATLLILFLWINRTDAQTSISGIVNEYAAVTAVDYPNNAMTLSAQAGIQAGDEVLILQMQGASISTSNNSTFGNVLNYQGAGNYEMATVCQVSGNTLTFENNLIHQSYQPAGKMQVVRIPRYNKATVTGPLTGRPWDGTVGGVMALRVDDTLWVDAPIEMVGKGFRGGLFENSTTNTCGMSTNRTDYAYNTRDMGGHKGEGIANFVNGSEYGRGAQANGGGGGNDHNSGGGGGANAAAGGLGGENQDPNLANCKGYNSGQGGKVLNLNNRMIMGGGGGAGHGNDLYGTRGGNGGGIILLIANTVVARNDSMISARGETAPNSASDGAGGGGAGGSIHLMVNNWVGAFSTDVSGGHGGSADNESLNLCFGPGGGGSGGVILVASSVPGSVSFCVKGGDNGQSINTSNFTCSANSSVGAQKGGFGRVSVVPMPVGTTPSIVCRVLPVEWLELKVTPYEGQNLIEWAVASERNNMGFTVERSLDGVAFQPLGGVSSLGNSDLPVRYQWTDEAPLGGQSFYRIKQTDFNGQSSFSEIIRVAGSTDFSLQAYPNPASASQPLQLKVFLPEAGYLGVRIFNVYGQVVFVREQSLEAGSHHFSMEGQQLSAGTYFAKIQFGSQELSRKIVLLKD